jgi:hypothetical protein
MLFEGIEIDQEFDFCGMKWRKIKKRVIPIGISGFMNQNMELMDQSIGYVSGYLADDQEVNKTI